MIVFRVFTHGSGLKPTLMTLYILVLHTKRIKAKKYESGGLRGVGNPLLARLSLHPPLPWITKKVRGHWLACLRKPCFQTFRKELGEGRSLAKKNYKFSSQSEKIVPFKQLNYCTINPNILSLARNVPVQHGGQLKTQSGKYNTNYNSNTWTVRRRLF